MLALRTVLAAVLLNGCALFPRQPGTGTDMSREAVHAHLDTCYRDADLYARMHGEDAMRRFHCEDVAVFECVDRGFSQHCVPWALLERR